MEQEIRWRRAGGSPVLELRQAGDVPFLSFPSLRGIPGVIHGFSTRLGGVSEGELATMNLSFTRGDEPERVRENYRRIAGAIGFSPEDMVFSSQTHTVHVRAVTGEDRGKGYRIPRDYQDVDALVTDEPGLVLVTFYADCVPLFFVDPVRRAVGLAHSGWRGTVSDIAGATVAQMHSRYGSEPSDLIAAVGPSICRSCYEVGEDVIEQVRGRYPEELWDCLFDEKGNGKYQLDLWEACRQNLLRAGILPEHLSVTDLCTCCNPKLLFSHRASGGRRGNMAAFLALERRADGISDGK